MDDCLVHFWACGIWILLSMLAALVVAGGLGYVIGQEIAQCQLAEKELRALARQQRLEPWEIEAAG